MSYPKLTPIISKGATKPRYLEDRFADVVNVKDFGAVGNGSIDDTDAIQAMIDAEGYALFLHGEYKCRTATFDAPLLFSPGSALVAPLGVSVTITSRIQAPKIQIFKGNGTFILAHDEDSGEDARHIHAAWFGCFPSSSSPIFIADNLQKAIDSFGNEREGIIEFDVGSYYIDHTIYVKRGIWIKGAGIRRCVFLTMEDGWPIFETQETACRFTDIQTESRADPEKRTYPFIKIMHEWCYVKNIEVKSQPALEIHGVNCQVDGVWAVSGVDLPSGSSLIKVFAGGLTLRNVYGFQSGHGPENMVSLHSVDRGVSNVLIENIFHLMPSRSLFVECGNYGIASIIVNNIRATPYSLVDACVYIKNNGTGIIRGIRLNQINGFQNLTDVVKITQNNASATTKYISLDNISNCGGISGISITNSAGTMSNIELKDGVDIQSATTPLAVLGTVQQLSVAPGVLPGTAPSYSSSSVIDDDTVETIDVGNIYSGMMFISGYGAFFGFYCFRTINDDEQLNALFESTTVSHVAAGVALNGTTGDDGKLTIGVKNKKIYIENRLGRTGSFTTTIMAVNV